MQVCPECRDVLINHSNSLKPKHGFEKAIKIGSKLKVSRNLESFFLNLEIPSFETSKKKETSILGFNSFNLYKSKKLNFNPFLLKIYLIGIVENESLYLSR